MAVSLNPRAERLLARLPRVNVYTGLELLLLLLIAIQCARLFWGVLTPIGPIGEFRALDRSAAAPAPPPTLGAFDPFFRGGQGVPAGGAAVVTSLDVRLFGISANRATGGGSAIIGSANGEQRVYMVGEEIAPGVILSGVGFDFVTVSRSGQEERLYLDQTPSGAAGAQPVAAAPPSMMTPQPVPVPIVTVPPAPPTAAPQPPR